MNYQVPRGTHDILPSEIAKWHKIEDVIRQFCYVYNYKEIRTPIFEHTEVFKRGNDSSDMVNKEMYTFEDNGQRSLTLRPEGTAGVVRAFVENKLFASQDLPLKTYYVGPQFRYERPQKGRQRIFHQFGVEAIGAKDPMIDVETIALGWSIVQALGLSDLKVLINTLGDDESRNNYREALKTHFAPHLETMCGDCKRRFEQNPLRILDCKADAKHEAMQVVPNLHEYLTPDSKAYFAQVLALLDELEIPYELDDRLVRGLDYYTHTVFEVVSENKNMGSQSTVFAGGRYDRLVEYFGGPEQSGIGFAMGLERLIIACEGEGIALAEEESIDVYVMCLDQAIKPTVFTAVTALRNAGYKTEVDYLGRSFKAQFKSVDRMKAQAVVLLGQSEVDAGVVKIKRIADQKQIELPFEQLINGMDSLLQEEEHNCGEGCKCQGGTHEENA
ncbi:MAG: histidine--tRNA ligase [Erysipelotrichaceae bacterium]